MVRLWRGGLAVLVLGLAVGVACAQQPGGSWLPSWLGGGKPAPRPEDKAPSLHDKDRRVPDRQAELEVLRNACLRRMAVCTELDRVASATKDEWLREEAQRLMELTGQLYKDRSEKLLGARSIGLGEEPKVDGTFDETRELLLGTRRDRPSQSAMRRAPVEGGDR
jgi:hypothetical protein